jgi:hypothetical protein
MKLDVSERTLAEFLATPQEQLAVPLYQRQYSWTTEEVDQLWEDVTSDLEAEHFMGSIVLNDELLLRPQIIDGQQRLSTIMIILGLIRDEYHDLGSKYVGRPQMSLTADPWATDEARFKLQLGELNHAIFRDFVLRPPDDPHRKDWAAKKTLHKDDLVQNADLFSSAERLHTLLKKHLDASQGTDREAQLITLEEKISKRLLFVVIRVGSVDDAFLLFETLNDRGLQLSAADLVKSHLLSRIESEKGKEKVAEAAHEWAELVEQLRGADIGRFLRYFLLMYYPKVRMDRVFKLFKTRLQEATAEGMLGHLRTMARLFGEFERPSLVMDQAVRDVLEDINDLRASTTYVVLLPARHALIQQPKDFVRLARLTEALAYRWTTIAGKNAQQLESIFQEAGGILASEGAEGLEAAEDRLTQELPSKIEFLDSFRNKRMGTQYVARYTLRRIEEVLSNKLEWTLKSPAKVNVEHIMPLNLSQPWLDALGSDAVEIHAENVGRWGNLTLLSESLNKSAKDSSFEAKKKSYAGPPGSSVQMTQLLLNEDSWGPKEIDLRQRWLGEIAEQLWNAEAAANPGTVVIPKYPFVDPEDAANQIRALLNQSESGIVEFKSTARTNLVTEERDPAIEKGVGKTICAFANSPDGGTLLIGVSDDGDIVGMEPDYKFVKHGNDDGFLLWLSDYVKEHMGILLASKIRPTVVSIDGKKVCRVEIPPASEPNFHSEQGTQRFYVRISNATHELSGHDLLKYRSERWPDS